MLVAVIVFIELEGCGGPIHEQLKKTCDQLKSLFRVDYPTSTSHSSELIIKAVIGTAEALWIYADEKILSYPYKDVPACWRQLYTDANLIKVSAILAHHQALSPLPLNESDEATNWSELIRLLDMSLIVAGAPGKGRKEALFLLVKTIQDTYLSDPNTSRLVQDDPRPYKRARTLTSSPSINKALPFQPCVQNPMPTFDQPPSLARYVDKLHRGPFVIKGYCSHWKALQTHPWQSIDYLKSISGPGRVVPVEVGEKYTDPHWGQQIIPWYDFLDSMQPRPACSSSSAPPLSYLAQYDLFHQFPQLRDDISLPDYVYCDLPEPLVGSPRLKPVCEEGVICNAWLGPGGTVSPAHVDPYFNCYGVCVCGVHPCALF